MLLLLLIIAAISLGVTLAIIRYADEIVNSGEIIPDKSIISSNFLKNDKKDHAEIWDEHQNFMDVDDYF